jgi:hypothetical protein
MLPQQRTPQPRMRQQQQQQKQQQQKQQQPVYLPVYLVYVNRLACFM